MAAGLGVMVPVVIDDSRLVSSNVIENDAEQWQADKAYAIGGRCLRGATHRIFESMRDNNKGKDPSLEINQADPAPWWKDLAPTNKHAMFDGEVSTQTEVAEALDVVMSPGGVNAVFAAGLDGDEAEIIVTAPAGGEEVFRYQQSLEDSAPADWFEHFYEEYRPVTNFLVTGLEPFVSCEVQVILRRASGVVKCGVLAVGDLRPLGNTQFGVTAEPKSFASIKTNEFGKTKIRKGKKAKDMTASAVLPIEEANAVLNTLEATLGVPSVWVATDLPQYAGARAFGLGIGKLTYENPKEVLLTLNVSGMI